MAGEWLNTLYFDAEGVESRTTKDQKAIEAKVGKFYRLNLIIKDEQHYVLDRVGTILFIQRSTVRLSTGYSSLHCSQPWLVYWTMHGLDVLNAIPQDSIAKGVSTLCRCQDATRGGFGGGPDQLPHCLASYAAINAYATLGSEEGYRTIDRLKMYKFLMAMKDPVHGGFASQNDGELDIRSTYCALSIASMLNLLTPELAKNSAKYIASCQTYEGGMGGTPGAEAHGGYAFCGLAGLVLLGQTDAVDISALLHWAVSRQMSLEGGFQGRTNKLVDSCYSFWQGALFPLLHRILKCPKWAEAGAEHERKRPFLREQEVDGVQVRTTVGPDGDYLYDQFALQEYLLECAQEAGGGLRDKPGKSRDLYHTCYSLSGLSLAQHNSPSTPPSVLGGEDNLVVCTLVSIGGWTTSQRMRRCPHSVT
eukprot:TRINITY_DN1622_c0_g3_i1.p1 TRINITY_DN1622_c0_g3~~TRINITY_DN1622_c0_g3_i1.p1  ORF type:complete len:462 (-),score=52.69 TRINITY_DN1622_c0_g3_i1:567-1826(-)